MTRINKVWTKIDNQWKPVEILYKTNDGVWENVCPSIKDNDEWIKKCSINFTPGSFTERYLNTFNPEQRKIFEGNAAGIPGIPGITSGTDVTVQYSSAGNTFAFMSPNPGAPEYSAVFEPYPYTNAVHMCLIPKGPHRGKVMILSNDAVIASGSPYLGVNTVMSFQPMVIADFSKNLQPGQPRFLNFLIPIETSSKYYDVTFQREDTAYPNLFCCGHAWSPSGDLIIGAGSRWSFDYPDTENPIIGAGYGRGRLLAWNGTYVWNPALPGSWTSSVSGPSGRVNTYIPFTSGHYVSAGSWTRGPDLKEYRWYPTILPYPKVSRTNNHHHALIFGGETLFRDPSLTEYDLIPSSFNTYESFVISSMATSSNPGVYADRHPTSLSYIFSGPSKSVSSQVYLGAVVATDPVTKQPIPTGEISYESSIYNDSLYYYPRCFTTSSGGVCFGGFSHRSSLLYSHDLYPGVWDNTVGNASSTFNLGNAHDFHRWYGSAFREPNNLNPNNIDTIYRCGGSNVFNTVRSEQDTWTVDKLELNKISGLTGTNNYINWKDAGALLNEKRSTFNTVLLPDASVFAVGGVENDLTVTQRLNNFFEDDVRTIEFSKINPLEIADHHHIELGPEPPMFDFGPSGIRFAHSHHNWIEHAEEEIAKVYDVYEPAFSTDSRNTQSGYRFFVCPEILNPERTKWDIDFGNTTVSWRDYHSNAILLPDGRIVCGGGDARHTPSNPRLDPAEPDFNKYDVPFIFRWYADEHNFSGFYGNGWDFEIYSPSYLNNNLKPTGVGLSGATFNNNPQVSCHQLIASGPYIVSSNSLPNNAYLNKVILMAPGNSTHHADTTQRYYQCQTEIINNTQIKFTVPTNENILPLGFYMLFVLTNENVCSEAIWVWRM